MEDEKLCCYDIMPFTKEEVDRLRKYHSNDKNTYIRVGPARYVLPTIFLDHAEEIRNMPLRADDVFVVSYPRSGTTWTQELVWLVVNDLDYEKSKSIPLIKRYEFLEKFVIFTPEMSELFEDEIPQEHYKDKSRPSTEVLKAMKSRRFIKTHLPLSLLPTATLDTTKVVYVARDIRDVAVSVYHFFKAKKYYGIECGFKEYYHNMIAKNMIRWSPHFEHIKEAWTLRDHPNMLFLFYEDMSKDLKASAKRVADFFGKQYTDEQLDQLCSHLAFDNLKKNKAVNLLEVEMVQDKNDCIIRKGKAGGWREVFDEEMTQHAERWIDEELRGTGLMFPR